jgi:hypothetical protein
MEVLTVPGRRFRLSRPAAANRRMVCFEAQGGDEVAEGSSTTVTATPDGGFHFVQWKESGTVVSTSRSHTFTMPSKAVTLVADFQKHLRLVRVLGGSSNCFPLLDHRFDAAAFAAGGNACKPRILGIGPDSGHHEPQHEGGNRRETRYLRGAFAQACRNRLRAVQDHAAQLKSNAVAGHGPAGHCLDRGAC